MSSGWVVTSHTLAVLTHGTNQEERVDENGFSEPSGFHLIPLPFADDIRAAPMEEALRGAPVVFGCGKGDTEETFVPLAKSNAIDAAKAWIAKLQIKNGGYPPDANPNPGAFAYTFHVPTVHYL